MTPPNPNLPLTASELQVLNLIAEGLSNAEIARRLYYSADTVKYKTLRIHAHLQVPNRTTAALEAHRRRLLGSALVELPQPETLSDTGRASWGLVDLAPDGAHLERPVTLARFGPISAEFAEALALRLLAAATRATTPTLGRTS